MSSTSEAFNETSPWDPTDIDTPFHDAYHPLSDIYGFMETLATEYHGKEMEGGKLEMEGFVIGETFEKREIKGYRVRWKEDENVPEEIWLEGDVEVDSNKRGKDKGKGKGKKGGKKNKKHDIEREFVIQSGSHAREVS